jgi:hypothetical protein
MGATESHPIQLISRHEGVRLRSLLKLNTLAISMRACIKEIFVLVREKA